MASYEELQRTVDDLTFKVEDLLRWAEGLANAGRDEQLGALAFASGLDTARVGSQAAAQGNLGLGDLATRDEAELGLGDLATKDEAAILAEPNDFAHMPTVGGAPIVESGSNSDGEWTRWADGTQQCRLVFIGAPLTPRGEAELRIPYPSPFRNNSRPAVSLFTGVATAQNVLAATGIRAGMPSWSDAAPTQVRVMVRSVFDGNVSGFGVHVTAAGHWK